MGAFGRREVLAIASLRLGQEAEARKYLLDALQKTVSSQRLDRLMYALPGIAYLLAEEAETERAVELYALATTQPFVGHSRWFADVIGKWIEAATDELPAATADAARTRG